MPRGYQLPETSGGIPSVKLENLRTIPPPPCNGQGRRCDSNRSSSGENYLLDDHIDPLLLPRENAHFYHPLPTIKSPVAGFNPGYEHATANHITYTHHHNSETEILRPYMSHSTRNSPPAYPQDGYDRPYHSALSAGSHPVPLEPALHMFDSTATFHSDAVASGHNAYVSEYASTSNVGSNHEYSPTIHHDHWYRGHQTTPDSYRHARYDLNGHQHAPIDALPSIYLDSDMRPPFIEAYRGLDESISPITEKPRGALLPHHGSGSSFASSAINQANDPARINHGYMAPADISPHLYAPDNMHQHQPALEPSAVDPALSLLPPSSESKAKKTSKAKPVRRKSSRRDPIAIERPRAHLRSNSCQESVRVEFEAARELGGVPGCFVLTPTAVMGSSEDQVAYNGPIPIPRRVPKEKPRRKQMSEEERAAVKQNRINGVCFRCKAFKEKCRGGFPCERCSSIPLWRPICISMQFIDKRVFSRGLYRSRASAQLVNVKAWLSIPPRSTLVSNGLQPVLSIWVKEYTPVDGAMLDHILWRGAEKSTFNRFPSTAFGIKDEASLIPDLDRYIDEHIPLLLEQLDEKLDRVYVDTLNTAYMYLKNRMQGDALLQCALRIWAAQVFFFKKPWRFAHRCSDDLGMGVISSEDSPLLAGIRPLPRLLNQALDSLMEKRAADFEQMFLSELQARMYRRQPNEWFGIYLAVFVFLSGMEKDTWNLETWNIEVVSQRNHPHSHLLAWPLQDSPATLAEKNRHLVDTLVAYFRSVCKGQVPFRLDWEKSEYQAMAGNDRTAIDYMTSIGVEIKRRSDSFLKVRSESKYDRANPESLDMTFSCKLMYQVDD
ncbi:hypothetical protein DFH27DRAFT_566989 [Peziza echinospora]|nr:hypothetical protein DFH27DRAFT_566989 [Peziza echinospora]